MTKEEMFEVFGDFDPTKYEAEARERWGQTEAYRGRWFYPCSPEMHRGLGELYVSDSRFTENIGGYRPGLAQFMRDAFRANSERTTR